MEVHTVKCDLCGQQKASANHWFRVVRGERFVMVVPAEDIETLDKRNGKILDACGAACVSKAVSEFLGSL